MNSLGALNPTSLYWEQRTFLFTEVMGGFSVGLNQWMSSEDIFAPTGNLATSGDIFDCHETAGGYVSHQQLMQRDQSYS